MFEKHDFKFITTHGLRHTHCSILFEAGASDEQVQTRLGHSDIRITKNIYTHVTSRRKAETASLFANYMSV
ncbi:tyrosine-type recombinase/integrase [Enterococcus sp. BWR-S5]|uniref:tyrosine-type recombinase/integrase n=1 Tax=Enterococcus sp. BWR-S5 TaxID=2787714 RepID=UPI00192043D7|nr:tyrosine-type recombinase/integrase [Enterococcus sp. BWR-S5]